MNPKAYWVGFNLVKGIGAVRLRALLNHFGSLDMAWQAPSDALEAAGLSARLVQNLTAMRKQVHLDVLMERIERQGIRVITWEDEIYPRRLREIDQPPPVLYLRGSIDPEDDWAVAIVGTRRVTAYGRQITADLAAFLAGNGITVVSGLARGVDAIAHEAALQAGGRTIAVLGSGVDCIYPPEHRKLAAQIMSQGAVCSDYPVGTAPESTNFPPRNRIIAGLSQATVIIEAGETSGALITARFAADQGREVLAVPGPINAVQSQGTNNLIQQGARPLLRVEEILEVLNLQHIQTQQKARKMLPADETEAALLKVIGQQPVHVDDIQALSGLSIEKVSATLTLLELKGIVRQVGGMNYVAVRETPASYWTN
ncbi:MAG TPA: DNA-processing protein DprA [Levilinea sp.]|nr:DNA-processing protein DprA [Levilinea sp.]